MASANRQISKDEATERIKGAENILASLPADSIRGRAVLDVGCGTGNMLLAAIQAGAAEAVGVDINLDEFGYNWLSELAAERGIDSSRISLHQTDFGGLPVGAHF